MKVKRILIILKIKIENKKNLLKKLLNLEGYVLKNIF
jgi:hypothetical protein